MALAQATLITPRGVRRALLRACPLPLIVGGVALGAGASPGVALVVAIPCLTPGATVLLGVGLVSALAIGMATPVLTALSLLADELEQWLWPLEATP